VRFAVSGRVVGHSEIGPKRRSKTCAHVCDGLIDRRRSQHALDGVPLARIQGRRGIWTMASSSFRRRELDGSVPLTSETDVFSSNCSRRMWRERSVSRRRASSIGKRTLRRHGHDTCRQSLSSLATNPRPGWCEFGKPQLPSSGLRARDVSKPKPFSAWRVMRYGHRSMVAEPLRRIGDVAGGWISRIDRSARHSAASSRPPSGALFLKSW